jgi:hypothetical protein
MKTRRLRRGPRWPARRAPRTVSSLLVAALVGAIPGAASIGEVQAASASVTVVRSLVAVSPTETPSGTTGATLTALRNEFESFQIVVSAGDTAQAGVSVAVLAAPSNGAATIPAANIRLYREDYYRVTTPSDSELGLAYPCATNCDFADPLIPEVDVFHGQERNAFPVNIPANQNRVAWVDVLVPSAAPAGTYTGGVLRVTRDPGQHAYRRRAIDGTGAGHRRAAIHVQPQGCVLRDALEGLRDAHLRRQWLALLRHVRSRGAGQPRIAVAARAACA